MYVFYYLVCPGNRQQYIPSEYSMKQDIRLTMDLSLYKGVWDTNLGKVIAPKYQKIVFNNREVPFAFNVTLDHDVPSEQYFNTTWSKIIDADVYNENDYYVVVIEMYYKVQTGMIVEKCTGENVSWKYKPLDTAQWICFNATISNPELIKIDKLCDGIHDCSDSSDEAATLCTSKYLYFE